MKFVDETLVFLEAGKGGNGCLSFRREKFIPKGGPDGGNGGHGGSVYLEADRALQTLADLEYNQRWLAESGDNGRGKNQHGKRGEDVVVRVPCGTLVFDAETGAPLADLVEPGDRLLAARGGRAGRGNAHFANSIRKTPRFAEKGERGEKKTLRLELKLIADVGLVGIPNAGKSSLLAAMSNATPKIAAYPFTTLSPNLGVLAVDDERMVLADIPGLIEGASENRGLGHAFLRHIERTRLLVYVLDLSSGNLDDVLLQWNMLREEFSAFDRALLERPGIVVGNKTDLLLPGSFLDEFRAFFQGEGWQVYTSSALQKEGIEELVSAIIRIVREHPRPRGVTRFFAAALENVESGADGRNPIQIVRIEEDLVRILHPHLEKAVLRFDFGQDEAVFRFNNILRKYRVEQSLEAAGVEAGETIQIGDFEFEFRPERGYDDVEDEAPVEQVDQDPA